jgi:hypothetical protein
MSPLDIRNLTPRMAKATEMLKSKSHGYGAHGWASEKTTLQQLAVKAQSRRIAICQPKGCSCGWSEIYRAKFCVDDYQCLHTVICCPEPVFPKLNPIPDLKTDRHTVRTASGAGPWNFCHHRYRRKFTPFQETENTGILAADRDQFINRFMSELLYASNEK